jgi:hypothetical protein
LFNYLLPLPDLLADVRASLRLHKIPLHLVGKPGVSYSHFLLQTVFSLSVANFNEDFSAISAKKVDSHQLIDQFFA